MNKHFLNTTCILLLMVLFSNCTSSMKNDESSLIGQYGDILDISYTPNNETYCTGLFSDQGSWIGFTIPDKNNWINGFCGPLNLDSRYWISKSLVTVGFNENPKATFTPDTTNYYPGEIYLKSSSDLGSIEQRLFFIDSTNAILECKSTSGNTFYFTGEIFEENLSGNITNNSYSFTLSSGDQCIITFPEKTEIEIVGNSYKATTTATKKVYVIISFIGNPKGQSFDINQIKKLQSQPAKSIKNHYMTWNGYLTKILRDDMPQDYNRIAVKSIVTLMSNWRSSRGGLLHEGVVPSHAVGYFLGFWAWDSWKHAVALAKFNPELAKNQVRAMFDYQQKNGMIIDCIYPDINENNYRDSKPPLAAWAVNEIFKETSDTLFVKEMFSQLVKYHQWWYQDRDHNQNGICEFGSVDGTLVAAAWESGMDNAIRFDNAEMVKNAENAWSVNQESVDLNAFLAYEYKLLKKLAVIAKQPFNEPDHTSKVHEHFYDAEKGFFFDKKFNGEFIREEGSEAYIPLWAGIATKTQVKEVFKHFSDTTKFSTYIPFPTVAADNPKFMPKGYWRGPIWLDQTYFAISGLRNYGYTTEADNYTRQVFDRLQGLKGNGAIHENYGTHTGEQLKAPHFSWSAAHLLMLYNEFGKNE